MRKAVMLIILTVITASVIPLAGSSAAPRAPQPGSPGIGDPYFPLDGNGGYNVSHYDLRVRFKPKTHTLAGVATIKARATQSLSRFNLDLVGLEVDRVRVSGARATWNRSGAELQVTPARPVKRGAKFTAKVWYHGAPVQVDDGAGGVIPTADGAIVIGEPHVASTWFPVNDHPADKASYTFRVTVPRGVEAVANGKLVRVRKHRTTTTWTWRAKEPMASYLATATTGQFTIKSYAKRGVRYIDALDPTLFKQPEKADGKQFAISGSTDLGYERLIRTFTVPSSGGRLSFDVYRDTEPSWDYFFVEAHQVGSASWTTLPDVNGHSSTDTGSSCGSWPEIHPFLAHYQSVSGGQCTATGTTGSWNAATAKSDGAETWSVDLSPYAGQQVEVALTVATDDVVHYPGVEIDNVVGPGGQGSTSFEADSSPFDGWAVSGPPAGSPGNEVDWHLGPPSDLTSIGERARKALDREPEIIKFLSSIYGRYPFSAAGGIVDNDDPELGFALENQTRPVYSKAFFTTTDEDAATVVLHELSHQWTGDSLTVAAWQHTWLNEGFATYAEWLWLEHEKQATAQQIFDNVSSIPADDEFWQLTIGDPGADNILEFPVYFRGALTLHALRLRVGDPAFFKILRTWTTAQRGGHVRTAEFVKLAEKVSGQDLGQFFDEWLFTAGKPAGLDVAANRTSAGKVVVRELQTARRLGRR